MIKIKEEKKRIVIIGGGFAGLYTARALKKKLGNTANIELISKTNYFVFQPLLPEVAAGTINAQDAVTPLRLLLPGVMVRLASVESIDAERRVVTLLQGQRRLLQELSYDELVIATGQETDLSRFPGLSNHSLTMKNVADAYRLRNHIIQCMETADATRFEAIKQRALTFVVAGGGFSGVETMGEIVEMIKRIKRQYPNIQSDDIKFLLIQRGKRLLPEMPEQLGEFAYKNLIKRGVDVRLKTGIASASRYAISFSDGTAVPTNTIVTTIGSGPSQFIKMLPVELYRGKLPISPELRVKGLDHVWSLGDVAALAPEGDEAPLTAPPTAQCAVQQSQILANNLTAAIKERKDKVQSFTFKSKGMLASLGGYAGVAAIGPLHITGLLGWLLWRSVYIGMLPGFSSRLRVALNWLFDYFLPRTIVHMSHEQGHAIRVMNFRAGELVHDRDEVLEGFYVVLSGQFERVFTNTKGESSRRLFMVGDSWGDRCITEMRLTMGQVTAVTDGELLLFPAADFSNLRSAYAPFNDLFAQSVVTKRSS